MEFLYQFQRSTFLIQNWKDEGNAISPFAPVPSLIPKMQSSSSLTKSGFLKLKVTAETSKPNFMKINQVAVTVGFLI